MINYKTYDLYTIRLKNRIEGLKINIARIGHQLKSYDLDRVAKKLLENDLKESYDYLKEMQKEYNEI